MIKFFHATAHTIHLTYAEHIQPFKMDQTGSLFLQEKIDLISLRDYTIEAMTPLNNATFLFILSRDKQKKLLIMSSTNEIIYEKWLPFHPYILSIVQNEEQQLKILFAFPKDNAVYFAIYLPLTDQVQLISPPLHKPQLGFWNENQTWLGVNDNHRSYIFDYSQDEPRSMNLFHMEQTKLLSQSDSFIVYALIQESCEHAAIFNTHTGENIFLDIYASEFIRATLSDDRLLLECIEQGKWQYWVHSLQTNQTQIIDDLPGVITGGVLSKDGTTLIGRYESFSVPPSLCSYHLQTKALDVYNQDGTIVDKLELLKPNYHTFSFKHIDVPYFSLNDHVQDKALIYLHGGPHAFSTETYSPLITKLCEQGYRIISLNFPGSTGFGGKYKALLNNDWGGIDIDTILACRNSLLKHYREVSIYGVSYGGYLALLAGGKQPTSWDKIIACAPFIDLVQLYATADVKLRGFLEENIGELLNDSSKALKRSPANYLPQLQSSKVLLIHGEQDLVCPIQQTEDFYSALCQLSPSPQDIKMIKIKDMGHETYAERFWVNDVLEFLQEPKVSRI